MASWYNSDAPESAALRAAFGAYPASPETLESWPGFVAVTNAYLDHAGPPTAPAAVQFERAVAEEELGSPVIEEQAPPTMADRRRQQPIAADRLTFINKAWVGPVSSKSLTFINRA